MQKITRACDSLFFKTNMVLSTKLGVQASSNQGEGTLRKCEVVRGRSAVGSFLQYLYSPPLACCNYRPSFISLDYPNSMPEKTTVKTCRCWHKERFFCSLLLGEQHLAGGAGVSAHRARADSGPCPAPHGPLTENTADPSLAWRLVFN